MFNKIDMKDFGIGVGGEGGVEPNGETATLISKNELQIGDVIYTMDNNLEMEKYYSILDNSIRVCKFSPDGTKLVLGGQFTGNAKIYSVSGTTITYISDIYADAGATALNNTVFSVAFSPDGTKLVLGGLFSGYSKIYTVSGTTVTYVSDIYANAGTNALGNTVRFVTFSPDGTKLVLGGLFTGRAKIYTVNGTTVTYVSDIYANVGTTALSNTVISIDFSPDGTKLVLGGDFTGFAKIYSVSGTTVTFVSDIYANIGTTALNNSASSVAFSPDGTKLVLGGSFSGYAKIYSVSGTTVTFVSDIYANVGTTALSSTVHSAIFSPNGNSLVLGGGFTGRAKIYTVSGTTVTFVNDIYADAGATALNNTVYSTSFSPNGNSLVLGGVFSGNAKIYTVSGTTLTYVSDIYANAGTNALGNTVRFVTFSPDGTKLVLGGDFTGRAKIYTVNGTTVTYVSNIYADAGTTVLNNSVVSASFSPDGTKLVLGGDFTGRAKIYSISGTTVTFVSDIYANVGTTALNGTVSSIAFSPDGTKLVVGGSFTGYAKIYSISGTTVTFVSDIYANVGTTALSSTVNTVVFSPNGNSLVLGGGFTGNAKIYSVSGTTVTFVSDIYANVGTTALSGTVTSASFSPNGNSLVLGGGFTGYAKIYSVSGTTVTFVSDIYADAGTTGLDITALSVAFSPNGNSLVLGGGFIGRAKIYSVNGTTVTFISNIYADAGTTALNNTVSFAFFSTDGTKLVLGGSFTGRAKIYELVDGDSNFIFRDNIKAGNTYLSNSVNSATFSTDGTKLVLGGVFTGGAKIYSVSGTIITFVSNIYADAGTTALSSVNAVAFSPDGTKLIIGGSFAGYAKIYSVSGTTVTFVSNIYADAGTTALNSIVNTVVFSPNGNSLVLGGVFANNAKIYSISGTTVTFVNNIFADAGATALNGQVMTLSFSPNGNSLVLGGGFTGQAKIYNVSGTTVTFVSNIFANAGTTLLSNAPLSVAFSPNGNSLVLGGQFTGHAKIYSVSGTTVTFVSDIYANAGTFPFNASVFCVAFSPDGTKLVVGGSFTDRAKIYSVSGTTVTFVSNISGSFSINPNTMLFSPDGSNLVIAGNFSGWAKIHSVSGTTVTYVSDIYANIYNSPLTGTTWSASFSPDGTKLVLGGDFVDGAKLYTVDGTTLTFISSIYADAGTTLLSSLVYTVAFSPDGNSLVLGGNFLGRAKIYSVSGTTVTYVSDIYANVGTTALSTTVFTSAFSPDGTKLVLGGAFAAYAKIYSVSGTTVTFVSNIYADTGTTLLNTNVLAVAFSPDSAKLVLGGNFTGRAKIYSVSGTTVTYISDIYADAGTTILNNGLNSVAFSPDGNSLIIGGSFTGNGKIYSVSGTIVTFVSNIYADAGTTALGNILRSIAFSPNGNLLVLGGQFAGRAKVYNVSGTTVTYLSDMYANNGTTILDNAVHDVHFSPDGTKLTLGGVFTDGAKLYSGAKIAKDTKTGAYKLTSYIFTRFKRLGYALENLSEGQSGTFKLLKS
jgi:WD40 repeat protein